MSKKPMLTSDVLATSVAVVALRGIRRHDNYDDGKGARILEQLKRINQIFFRKSDIGGMFKRIYENEL
ncbi:unnamed protein product [Macrosiphum euphorbiae]|uniref:Uncharacterized protein n=1 Tax=Macrosiphum euphorbiae TaxID=13131 RepID=A0AAV0WIG2_9HEMI|nr:unnamed protein product [Macrosiphum euphorbiae]